MAWVSSQKKPRELNMTRVPWLSLALSNVLGNCTSKGQAGEAGGRARGSPWLCGGSSQGLSRPLLFSDWGLNGDEASVCDRRLRKQAARVGVWWGVFGGGVSFVFVFCF